MRSLQLAIISFCCLVSFQAAAAVEVSITPVDPVVVTADLEFDGTTILSPWIQTTLTLSMAENETAFLHSLETECVNLKTGGKTWRREEFHTVVYFLTAFEIFTDKLPWQEDANQVTCTATVQYADEAGRSQVFQERLSPI